MRDPKVNPQPGDALIGEPKNGYGRRQGRVVKELLGTIGGDQVVVYSCRRSRYQTSMETWRRWAATAEVRHVAAG